MTADTPSPIDGRWQLLRAEFNGEDAPNPVVTKTEMSLANGHYEVRFAGAVTDRGTFQTGDAGEATTITLVGIEGANAGRTISGIYQHQGDRLRVCYGLDGVTPSTFSTEPGQNRYLATYARTL